VALDRFAGAVAKQGEIIENGFISPTDSPGLGVEMNEDCARKAQVPGTPWFEKV
jgi:L-alanine-DL-glutamate epimerase-like enolase superfamily enzyme